MAADAENRPMEHQNAGGGGGGGGVSLPPEQEVLAIPDVPRKAEDSDSHTQTGEDTGKYIIWLFVSMFVYG